MYTIVPHEHLYHGHPYEAAYMSVDYYGIQLQVEHEGGHSFRVSRILSTDPSHYLLGEIQPGSVLPFIKGFESHK